MSELESGLMVGEGGERTVEGKVQIACVRQRVCRFVFAVLVCVCRNDNAIDSWSRRVVTSQVS